MSSYPPVKWRGIGDLGESTGLYLTPDQQKMFSATTKKTYLIETPEQVCDIFEEAINIAFNGRPGPVHIDIPYDVMAMDAARHRDITIDIKPVLPLEKDIKLFADVLTNAIKTKKKIIAHIGYGAVRSHAEAELLQFVDRFQIPFITTMDAKGIIRENHPLSLGMGGISSDPGAKQAYKEADLVLAIGNSFVKWQCWRFHEGLFDNKTLMHINIDRKEVNKVYKADYAMMSDIKPAMAALTEAMSKKIGRVKKLKIPINKFCTEKIDYNGSKIHPGQLSQVFSKYLPERSIVLGDAGSHMIWLAAYTQFNSGQNYKNPGSFGPMASHINAAIGVQLANPDRRVIVGCGDGGYLMSGFEIMTAVEYKFPIIWIIFNNSEFNIIKLFHLAKFKKEVFNRYLTPDFAKYAEACRANGYRVERLGDFAGAFKDALNSEMPSIIDVIIDP
ncbi:MAG: thiamine pyrophosphate-binding protein, partial [Nitrospirae bacterium]|nr:thiamine pyrophosphate-binding protein [Nitrospirota bacterium]